MTLSREQKRKDGGFSELLRTIFSALVIALVIRTFLFQPFNIPSGSMEPTLLIGDFLFVSKFSYGYSRFSFPFSPPLFPGRIPAWPPERGDVVVFRPPQDESTDFIKRLVGLPGDRIQVIDGVLQINGTAVKRVQIQDFVGVNPCGFRYGASDAIVRVKQWQETLPNGVTYATLDCANSAGRPDNTEVFLVPPGHYFMMGDNRDNSDDSRFDVGYVPYENLVGRAQIIFFSVADGEHAWAFWRWPWTVRWSRLLTLLR